MKGFIVLIIVVIAGVWAAYQYGGFATLDPKAQADNIRNNVKPGMTWKQVVDVHKPKRFVAFTMEGNSPRTKYTPELIQKAVDEGSYVLGFAFQYEFSPGDAVQVIFDPLGTVQSVENMFTTKDLFEGKAPAF